MYDERFIEEMLRSHFSYEIRELEAKYPEAGSEEILRFCQHNTGYLSEVMECERSFQRWRNLVAELRTHFAHPMHERPQPGHRIIIRLPTTEYAGAIVDECNEDEVSIVTNPYYPFISKLESDKPACLSVSGGYFNGVEESALLKRLKRVPDKNGGFKTWGVFGPRANGALLAIVPVPTWELDLMDADDNLGFY